MSKRGLSALVLIFILLLAACGPSATATPKPAATAAPAEVATEEATAEVTEAATEEATAEVTEVATEEVTAEVTEAATEEATAEVTEAATEEVASIEAATEEATVEVALAATEVPTEEVTAEPTEDIQATTDAANAMATDAQATTDAAMAAATDAAASIQLTTDAAMAMATDTQATVVAMAAATEEPTVEPTVKPTIEPTAVPTEATEEATAEVTEAPAGDLIPIRLQLQWVAQSQFAGYYAAVAQGFYKDEGLDVTILEGAVDIVPQQVVASGGAEFGIAWVPKVLASREQGADLVNIAQIFQRSGTLEVSFKDKGIEGVPDLKGLKVGTWGFGNEHELFAALRGANIDPNNPDDVTIVQQPFDMSLLLNGEVDAAEAMTYNEYAQVLEQTNPATGKLYQPDELNVINFNEVGTAMLQDHIFTLGSWLSGETNGTSNEDIAVKFIRASIKGWIYARDHFDETVDIVLANGPTLGKGHMAWQLNEINKLIWPSPAGIGVMDAALWNQTVKVALDGKVITAEPTDGAYRSDLAQKAVDSLTADGVDVAGADYKPQAVEITAGGE